MKIVTLTNEDEQFYPIMGPYLARQEIILEVGGITFDHDEKSWMIGISDHAGYATDNPVVMGFVGAKRNLNGTVTFESDYVRPEYRGMSLKYGYTVYEQLWRARFTLFGAEAVDAFLSQRTHDIWMTDKPGRWNGAARRAGFEVFDRGYDYARNGLWYHVGNQKYLDLMGR